MDIVKRAGDSASSTASSLFANAKGVAEQTYEGWERTKESAKENVELPEWISRMFRGNEEAAGGGGVQVEDLPSKADLVLQLPLLVQLLDTPNLPRTMTDLEMRQRKMTR